MAGTVYGKGGGDRMIEKRSQRERLGIVESLLVGINIELRDGKVEDITQQAVNCQVEMNRMVWKLNKMREEMK